jgi:hypothetical protein
MTVQHFWDQPLEFWQFITGVSSGIIALCALILSLYQGYQTRKHNRLSFKPHLTTWTNTNPEMGFYSVELINNGLGPALIEEFTVRVDGKVIDGRGAEPIEKGLKILFPAHEYVSHHGFVGKGYAMGPKQRCTIVAIQFSSTGIPSREIVEHAFKRGVLEVKYKSFYDELFRFSTAEERLKGPTQD